MKKKLLSALLFLLFCTCFLFPNTASAVEMEPVTFNSPFTGMLKDTKNDIYYSFTVDQTGYFYLDFSVLDFTKNTGSGWDISLHDGKTGNKIYGTRVTSATVFPTYNFKEGTKLYIKVSNADGYTESSAPIDVLYSMELVAVKDASWEQEGNDSIREATVLTQNTDCNGNLYYADDVDYYKYTVAETGYFNLDFSVTDITAETGSGWGVTFYNAKDGSEIYYKGIKESTTFPTFNFAKGTDVYVKVSRWEGHTDESVPDSVQYTLNVVSVKNNAWEQESNDTVKTASPLKANTLNTANLYHCDDEDYYVYKTANDGYFNLRMAFADLTADFGSGLSITAYNASDNTELWHFNMKGTGSITLPTSYFKKGTSVIFKVARVDGYTDASVPAFVPYTLKIDFTKTSYAEKESFQTAEESWSKRKKNATKMTSKKKYVGNLWNGTDNDLYTLKMKKTEP